MENIVNSRFCCSACARARCLAVYQEKMKVITPEVVWHEKQPILSVDFHQSGRLASGGADNFVRVSTKLTYTDIS